MCGRGGCRLDIEAIPCSRPGAGRATQKRQWHCPARAAAPEKRTAHRPKLDSAIWRRFVFQHGPSRRPLGLPQSPVLPEGCMCHQAYCMAEPLPCNSKDICRYGELQLISSSELMSQQINIPHERIESSGHINATQGNPCAHLSGQLECLQRSHFSWGSASSMPPPADPAFPAPSSLLRQDVNNLVLLHILFADDVLSTIQVSAQEKLPFWHCLL